MKLNYIVKLAAGLILSVVLCSCGKPEMKGFKGDWSVTQLQVDGVYQQIGVTTVTINEENKNNFHISGGTVSGNSFNGIFKISEKDNSIKCSHGLGVTKLLASKEIEEYENSLCKVLNNADYFKYGTEGDSEYIMISSKKYKAVVLLNRFKLSGVKWNYSAEKPFGVDVYILFQIDGHARGFDGVNSFDFPYEMNPAEGKLKFSDGAMTMALGGEPELMKLEDDFLKVIKEAQGYTVNGSVLTITDKKGKALCDFEADFNMELHDKLLELNNLNFDFLK